MGDVVSPEALNFPPEINNVLIDSLNVAASTWQRKNQRRLEKGKRESASRTKGIACEFVKLVVVRADIGELNDRSKG